jgi:hypothetical protein
VQSLPPSRVEILETTMELLQKKTPTLQHVPKACGNEFSKAVSTALERIIADPDSAQNWFLLLAIPKLVLFKPRRGGRDHRNQTSKLVKDRLKRFQDGDLENLSKESCKASRQRKGGSKSNEEIKLQHVLSYAQDGRYGKAARTLASFGLAKPSAPVLECLQHLHPHALPPSIPDDPIPTATTISEEQVAGAIRSFPEGTAPGPSSFRASFFKEAVFCPSPAQAS